MKANSPPIILVGNHEEKYFTVYDIIKRLHRYREYESNAVVRKKAPITSFFPFKVNALDSHLLLLKCLCSADPFPLFMECSKYLICISGLSWTYLRMALLVSSLEQSLTRIISFSISPVKRTPLILSKIK